VTEVSPDQLTLQKYESASEAIAAARKFIPPEGEIELAQNQDQIQALEAIRDLVRQHQISLEDLTRFLAS
jgi:nicotinate-nucleotide pyrophosphorylase